MKIDLLSENCKFWLSIKPVSECLFSRRCGCNGIRVFKHSIKIRVFGFEPF